MKSGFDFFSGNGKSLFPYTETSYVFYKKIALNKNTLLNNRLFDSGIPKASNALFFINCDEINISKSFFNHALNDSGKNYMFEISGDLNKAVNLFLYVFVTSKFHQQNTPASKWGIQLFDEKGELHHVSGQTPLALYSAKISGVNFSLKESFKLATLVKMYGFYSMTSFFYGWVRIGVSAIGVKDKALFAKDVIGAGTAPMSSSQFDTTLIYINCSLYD